MPNPLDEFMPESLFRERHEHYSGQPPATVWTALDTLSAQDMPVVRMLMRARSLPAGRDTTLNGGGKPMLDTMIERGLFELAAEPGRFVVLGSIGQFWRLRPDPWRRSCPPEEFPAYDADGFAKSAMAFELIPTGDGTTLRSETRVTGSGNARVKMSAYWLLIRPFSALIRRLMLRAVAARADRLARTP